MPEASGPRCLNESAMEERTMDKLDGDGLIIPAMPHIKTASSSIKCFVVPGLSLQSAYR